MKKIEKFIIKNWMWLVAGLVLTRKAVEHAYHQRGYIAFGGEWLVIPAILSIVYLARSFIKQYREVHNHDRRTTKNHRRLAR